MRILVVISRILVGTLFIFSGLIKANDILGFSYKLEEYWIEFGMGWDWLLAIDVPLAALICIFEIVLGVATIVGYKMKLTTTLLLLMIVFFTILTFASAAFGLVKSCGCFGDAIPLTPWQSFIKDVILLVFITFLFAVRKNIHPFEKMESTAVLVVVPSAIMAWVSFEVDWNFPLYFTLGVLLISFAAFLVYPKHFAMVTVIVSLIGSTWFSIHTLTHLPVKDFRPYAVGKSIPEQMKLPEGAKPPIYENMFIYRNKSTGEEKEFTEKDYPWNDDNWEFVDRKTTLIQEGDQAKITDFSIMDYEGNDYTNDILHDPDPVFLFISYNVKLACESGADEMGKFGETCNNNGVSIIGLSASDRETADQFRHDHQLMFDFYATDEITLKTMVRSNPGLVLIKGGVVLAKWHYNDTPSWDEVQAVLSK